VLREPIKRIAEHRNYRIAARGFIEICCTGCALLISFSTLKRVGLRGRNYASLLIFFPLCESLVSIKIMIEMKIK
jgi:hypothetical protein